MTCTRSLMGSDDHAGKAAFARATAASTSAVDATGTCPITAPLAGL